MCSLSNITGKDFIKFVESIGYSFVRQKGTHKIYSHKLKKTITIPAYKKRVIKKGLLRGLLSDIDISKKDFMNSIYKNKKEI